MLELVTSVEQREFDDRGRRWARCMLHRLQQQWMEVPLVWPGTHEQAETLVHAFTSDSLSETDREQLVEVVQHGARVAWRDLGQGNDEQGNIDERKRTA